MTLLDSYSEANHDGGYFTIVDVHPSSTTVSAAGHCFKTPDDGKNYKITSAKFYLMKTGLPTGNLVAVLYAMTGTYGTSGKPTGNPLATSNPVASSSLTGSYQLIEFTFPADQQYVMSPNTAYCIECQAMSQTINGANYVRLGLDSSSPTHDGNAAIWNAGQWVSYSTADSIFYVYGEEAIYHIQGVTRDSAGNPLGGCTVWLFKTSNKNFVSETTSDVNGNYSFAVADTETQYFIRSHKDGTPNVFGTTDRNLVGS